MHSNISDPQTDIAVLARASKFGSISHQHADQGSFAVMSGGTCLISPSGYFGATYGSEHHQQWTNQTQAHNCILIDGKGQAAKSHTATGKICSLDDDGIRALSVLDLSQAYDGVQSYFRRIQFDYAQDVKIIIIEDEVLLMESKPLSFLLHALSEPHKHDSGIRISRNHKHCDISIEGFSGSMQISDQYGIGLNQNIPSEFHVSMPKQYHMRWEFAAAKKHCIRTRITIT